MCIYQLSMCEEISAFNLACKRSRNAVYLAAEGRKGHMIDNDLTIVFPKIIIMIKLFL